MKVETYLRESPLFVLRHAARALEDRAAAEFAQDDLGLTEGLVLAAILLERPNPVRPSLLAETLATTRGSVSHVVSSLEAKGLVSRRVDPDDARAFILVLKPAGSRCAMRVIAAFDRLQHTFEHTVGKAKLKEMLAVVQTL